MIVDTTIKHDFEIYYQENKSWNPPKHMHDHYEIIFVVDGCANLAIESKNYEVRPHSLLVINRFENHDIEVTQYPYSRYVISMRHLYSMNVIQDDTLLSLLFQRPDSFTHVLPLEEPLYSALLSLLENLLREYQQQAAYQNLAVASMLNLFFVTLYRYKKAAFPIQKTSNITSVVVDIQRFICNNYKEDVVLEDLEGKYFLNKYYICHSFKEITGYTLKDYLTRQRLMRARELLQNTDMTVAKISEECGYNSVNHFNRIFLKREMMTPSAYRKRARMENR
ncbi:MAG: AraC family transcriptional regulator [Oscillospiraceae bacterium]